MNVIAEKYQAYVARLRVAGVALTSYACPECGESIESRVPPRGQVYDSMVTCPHCNALHFRATDHNGKVQTMKVI